ncbi:hypothetical protein [Bradyrhizobium sp. LHD-71]|uniref:hypothetical protein n=1 Tax=Bradyrhizobium sp. LHD-71 TaxID=3072141 RepID=UPI00280DC5A9|nr:hypothetical protein [Bradyrhizobium sp. LHD-71]MDQ8731064.1 hypothetical protein [Bradyrhizobium sp. LHD-71]
MNAYDMEMLHRRAEKGPDCQGWVFGLPPGITPQQWPLDPNNGYPLMHGFTVLLPEDYRAHGPEIVALSFFGTAPDHNDGAPFEIAGLREQVLALPVHPRLHRFQDMLDCEYALILLTQTEFDGPACLPPKPLIETPRPPDWMTMGAAASCVQESSHSVLTPEGSYIVRDLGEIPPPDLGYTRAIRWTPRRSDPNAGVPPRWKSLDGDQGYVSCWHRPEQGGNYSLHDWARDHELSHIGGTMQSEDTSLMFSPYYIEFADHFGGFNFGGRSGQLDFRDMQFDWN